MNTETKLRSWKKKTISKAELEGLLCTGSDETLYALVSDAVASGFLAPVKSSGTNGNRTYPLCLKYRITVAEDYADILSEIAMLHPALNKTGYLSARPEVYGRFRSQLQRLNSYLFRTRPGVNVSRKERSFEIFGEEKQLEDTAFRGLLDRLGLTSEVLHYYGTPEYCFHDYIPERKDRMILLIVENKDIWFNLRRRMYEDGAREVLGIRVDGAVYGEGNRVSEAGALSEYTRFMGAGTVQYLYWGDIDRAGFDIFLSLVRNNPETSIRLFVPAYEKMLRLSAGRELPDSGDHRERTEDYGEIRGLFSGEVKDRLEMILGSNKRLPQEIISYETLLKEMR